MKTRAAAGGRAAAAGGWVAMAGGKVTAVGSGKGKVVRAGGEDGGEGCRRLNSADPDGGAKADGEKVAADVTATGCGHGMGAEALGGEGGGIGGVFPADLGSVAVWSALSSAGGAVAGGHAGSWRAAVLGTSVGGGCLEEEVLEEETRPDMGETGLVAAAGGVGHLPVGLTVEGDSTVGADGSTVLMAAVGELPVGDFGGTANGKVAEPVSGRVEPMGGPAGCSVAASAGDVGLSPATREALRGSAPPANVSRGPPLNAWTVKRCREVVFSDLEAEFRQLMANP